MTARGPEPRRTAPCPLHARCGGCDLAEAEPAERLDWLGRDLARIFRRDTVPVVPSPRTTGHRARISLHFGPDGALGYRPARSHDVVDVDVCPIARPEVNAGLARLRAARSAAPTAFVGLEGVEIRTDGERVAFVFSGQPADPGPLRALGNVVIGTRTLAGDPGLHVDVGGLVLRVGPRAFYQVNLELNRVLGAFVREALRGAERVLDLYAGVGNLSLPLAAAGTPVCAVEAPGPGAEDLRANARPYGNVEVLAMPVERFEPSRSPFDAVVLDPPRAGAAGVLPLVARNRPKTIVYVSCFAPNAARDLAKITGYRLEEVRGFDLFPDTHHVEAVAVLRRA